MLSFIELREKLRSLQISLGLADGRRQCCGCGESEVMVGGLLDCPRILNKREYRLLLNGVIDCSLSRCSLVIPRVCVDCDKHIEKLQAAMVGLEVRIRLKNGEVSSMLIVEALSGVSLRALAIPELSLIPPLPKGIPVGTGI